MKRSTFFVAAVILVAAAEAPAQEGAPPPAVAPTFEQRLTALDLALSKTVAEPPAGWRFELLTAEAAELRAAATTDVERFAVRDVSNRLERFRSIAGSLQQPRPQVDAWRSPAGRPATRADGVAPPVRLTKRRADAADLAPVEAPREAISGAKSTATRRRHDAEGVLRPVVSKRPDAPKYAVVNDKGRVETFVTPAKNLEKRFDKLVGRRVALDGRRGYLADLKRNHLLAERVTPLSTRRR